MIFVCFAQNNPWKVVPQKLKRLIEYVWQSKPLFEHSSQVQSESVRLFEMLKTTQRLVILGK